MKRKTLSFICLIFILCHFFSPLTLFAQVKQPADGGGIKQPADNGVVTPCVSPCVPNTSGQNPSSFQLQVRLNNPLKVNTINDAITLFMNIVLKIALPFIIIFFIWSGFKFIWARGNEKKLIEAKQMFWYTVIGTLLVLGAWTITNAIIGTVNSIIG